MLVTRSTNSGFVIGEIENIPEDWLLFPSAFLDSNKLYGKEKCINTISQLQLIVVVVRPILLLLIYNTQLFCLSCLTNI